MRFSKLEHNVYELLAAQPVIDVHTHLVGGKLGARGLHDILLYHMGISDLYAAGCPTGARLTEYPGWPSEKETELRIIEAIPYLRYTVNTSTAWAIRMILADLYDWDEPITLDNWRKLDALIRERADDRAWHRDLLRRMNIKRLGTEWARRENGQDDDLFQYSLEWVFFTRCAWGEYDTALAELERAWGKTPEAATPIGKDKRPAPARTLKNLEDIHEAVAGYVAAFPKEHLISTAQHMSTDIDLTPPSDAEMLAALQRRTTAGARERNIYAAYINELYLAELERAAPELVFQFSFGAEPLPHETGCRLSQRTIAQIAEMAARHPGLRFQAFLASRHANQAMCSLCRELPNLSLAGYWWHNFFPSAIHQIIEERLDMLPLNKYAAFFSDAYCIEWTYGKLMLARQCMADVLATRVRSGQYTLELVVDIARQILCQTPQSLLGFKPSSIL